MKYNILSFTVCVQYRYIAPVPEAVEFGLTFLTFVVFKKHLKQGN